MGTSNLGGVTKDSLRDLFAPFKQLKFRVGRETDKKYIMLAYIDSRDVMDRLDSVCGPGNWKMHFYEVAGKVYCELSIRVMIQSGEDFLSEWVGKSDCGSESNVEEEKGQASDAFKRAAVHWGINRSAYRLDNVWLDKGSKKNFVKLNGKDVYISNQAVTDYCRKQVSR